MAQLQLIPKEVVEIIPRFDGDDKQLNLFIRKAEYVIEKFKGDDDNPNQDIFVFHIITSRLTGKAACLLSERGDISTWHGLKALLRQHFGDPRSEQCIAIELENLKIKHNETYTEFCNRIQHVRSTLIAKVNEIDNIHDRTAKTMIYNNTSLNTFLYNLPENMIRIVRLRDCDTLEEALSVVTEEVNFQYQYNSKRNSFSHQPKAPQPVFPQNQNNSNQNFKFGIPHQSFGTRPIFDTQNKFGTPNQGVKGFQYQPQGFRTPQNQPPQGFRFNQAPQGQGFKFGIPNQQTNFKFGIPTQNQGFRPQFNNNFNRSQPGFSGYPQQRFQFGIPHAQGQGQRALQDNDVSMRTVKQHTLSVPYETDNLFYNNDLDTNFDEQYSYYEEPYSYYEESYPYYEEPPTPHLAITAEPHVESRNETIDTQNALENENFRQQASDKRNQK